MIDRIEQLEQEARAAIDAAADTDALEDVRIRYLGRKAELPNLLRGVAQLPPEERAAVGKAANAARQALEAAVAAREQALAAGELEQRLVADRVDVTLPADPLPAIGRLHLITQTRREMEDIFIGLGFNVAEGPEVETAYYNFDALNTPRDPPLAADDRHVLHKARRGSVRSRDAAAAGTHLAGPGACDGEPAATALHRRAGSHLPSGLRRDAHAAVPPARGSGRRHRHHAGGPSGDAADIRPGDVRRRAPRCGCARTSSRSPSPASKSTSRASTATTA